MSEYGVNTKRAYREKALKNLDVPLDLRPFEYEVKAVRTGDDVLAMEGLSFQGVLYEPRHLLVGDVYNGGSAMALDPFHPATDALVALRMAASSGIPAAFHSANMRASLALSEHGVPPQIESAWAIDTRAAEFSAMDVIAVMPDLTEITRWRDRAQAAYEMRGALVAVPGDNPARAAIWEYTWLLSNPTVELILLEPYVDSVLAALEEWRATHEGGGWGIHQ